MKIDAFDGKKGIEKQMAHSIEMLEMCHKTADHRFAGCWSLIGNVGSIDDIETIVKPSFELYKIYGEKDMVILSSTGSVSYWPLQVNGEDQIIEGKNICNITWRSDNTFILSFDRGGRCNTQRVVDAYRYAFFDSKNIRYRHTCQGN